MLVGQAWTPSDPIFCTEYTSGSIQVALSNWEQVNSGPPSRSPPPHNQSAVLGSSDTHSPPPIRSSADESAVQNGGLSSLQAFSPIFQKIIYRSESSTGIVPKTPWVIVQFPALAPVMTEVLLYTCPNCEASCSVACDLAGLNVLCPSRLRLRIPASRRHSFLQVRQTRNSQKPSQQTHIRRRIERIRQNCPHKSSPDARAVN